MHFTHPQSGRNFIGPREIGSAVIDHKRRKRVERKLSKAQGQNFEAGIVGAYETMHDKKSVQQGRRDKSSLRFALLNPSRREEATGVFLHVVEPPRHEVALDRLLRTGPHPSSLMEEAALSVMIASAPDPLQIVQQRIMELDRRDHLAFFEGGLQPRTPREKPDPVDAIEERIFKGGKRGSMNAALARLVR